MQKVRQMLGDLNKDLASDGSPAAKKRLAVDAKTRRFERSRGTYARMFPLAGKINDGSGIAQDASLEDFHNFLDSLDSRADPNKAEDEETDLLDPKQLIRGTNAAKQKFVDDKMTKRFGQPGMDSADPHSFGSMFPHASKIRSI